MRRKNLQARILAAVLSASMVVSMCPVTASAAPEFPAAEAESGTDTGTDTDVPEGNPDSDTEEPSSGGSGSEDQGEPGSGGENDAGQSGDGEEGNGSTEQPGGNGGGDDGTETGGTGEGETDPEEPGSGEGTGTGGENPDSEESPTWVLMNIPYADFYKAELNENDIEVDAFSSATLNKSRTGTMVSGSYHVNADGSDITGVTFPVKLMEGVNLSKYKKVTDASSVEITVENRGQTSTTKYEGKDALFESASYSYYVLSETSEPEFYKELSLNEDGELSFSEVKGKATENPTEVKGVEAVFTTKSSYGDYQLDLDCDELADVTSIYGVIISTAEGRDYGLRHMENIWQKIKLSWATGFTTAVHGCPTSSDHYKAMMGQTITGLTYYTDQGIYKISLAEKVYVPLKFAYTLEVADASLDSGSTTVKLEGLPADYKPVFTVEGLKGAVANAETITFDKDAEKGEYQLKVHDSGNKYADITTTFMLTTSGWPVVYDQETCKLVPAENYSQEDVENYVKAITAVKVDDISYAPSGRNSMKIINEDGSLKTDAEAIKDLSEGKSYKIVVLATGYKDLEFSYNSWIWVLMNIPYADFYEADVNNTVKVDAFTSATLSKTRSGSLVSGSYHVNADGSDITGVIFPVKVSRTTDLTKYTRIKDDASVEITVTNRGQTSTTKYEGKDALFESASYSYYVLNEEPKYYKELSADENGVLSFGETQGESKMLANVEAEFLTDTTYGDYQINLTQEELTKAESIYGVILHTEENSDYGLRHMENIWQNTKLSWATGFTKDVHGCPTSSEHYKAMMGQTITGFTYYTSDGIYEVSLKNAVYVPIKFDYELEVKDAEVASGSTTITFTYPNDLTNYNPVYSVEGLEKAVIEGTNIKFDAATTKNDEYTLRIHDQSGKYADITTTFMLTATGWPVSYDKENNKLIPAENYSQEDVANYVKAITAVSVNGTSYAAAGRGAVPIINEDGSLKIDAAPIVKKGEYTISISAVGYKNFEFDYKVDHSWVLMNIPYADFYQADVNNAYPVDAFTSATLNKTRTGSLVSGSYHVNADGSDITGVTFPVKVSGAVDLPAEKEIKDDAVVEISVTNRGQTSTTTYRGKDALFESDSYSYYVLDEIPAIYKEASIDEDGHLVFGAIQGEVVTLEAADREFLTETGYGDYQLNLTCDPLNEVSSIYGVVISTEEGSDYGLRHMENIWQKTKLSWCTGFTPDVHGCPTSSMHYAKMMGQTIKEVTYYTNSGIYKVPLKEPVYVPIKFNYTLTVADTLLGKGSTKVKVTGMPKGFDAAYSVKGADGKTVSGISATKTKVTFDKNATEKGVYTLVIHDKKDAYADMQATFSLNTSDLPVTYDETAKKLTSAGTHIQADADAYVNAISSVSVNGVSYAASGRGAVTIINADGSLKTDAAQISAEGIYEIAVSVPGYVDCEFTYVNTSREGLYVYLAQKEVTYTGKAIKPTVYVSYNGEVLSAKNYKVKYNNNTKVTGTPAKVTVTGKKGYSGEATAEFTIVAKNLTDKDVTATCAEVLRKARLSDPKPVVKWGKKTLKKGTDYEVTPGNEPDAVTGIRSVTITGKGNYAGTIDTSCHYYEVKASKIGVVKIDSKPYTGMLHTPKINVTTSGLTEGTDYTVSYLNNLNKGTAKAVIKGLGKYGGTKTVTFKITAKKITDESITAKKDADGNIVVMDGKTMLKAGVDYTVNKNKTIIKSKGNYTGSKSI